MYFLIELHSSSNKVGSFDADFSFENTLQRTLLERIAGNYYSANYFLMLVALYMLFCPLDKKIQSSPSFPNILMSLIHCVQTIILDAVSVKVFKF